MLKIYKYFFVFCSCLISSGSFSDSIDAKINEVMSPISNVIANTVFYSIKFNNSNIPLIVVWLIIAAIFCTIYFNFVNIRCFKLALGFLSGKKMRRMHLEN